MANPTTTEVMIMTHDENTKCYCVIIKDAEGRELSKQTTYHSNEEIDQKLFDETVRADSAAFELSTQASEAIEKYDDVKARYNSESGNTYETAIASAKSQNLNGEWELVVGDITHNVSANEDNTILQDVDNNKSMTAAYIRNKVVQLDQDGENTAFFTGNVSLVELKIDGQVKFSGINADGDAVTLQRA